MKIDKMIETLSSAGRRKQDPIMTEVGLMYYGSILFNRYGLKKKVPALKSFVNMYVIMLANSGVGKDFTLKNIEKCLDLNDYPEQMEKVYKHHIELLKMKPDKEVIRFLPQTPTLGLDGTKEGLFYSAKAVEESMFGSLNLMSTEWIDSITGSQEMLSKLKELYDGQLTAKLIRGEKDDTNTKMVKDCIANFLGAGSISAVDRDTQKVIGRIARTGLYRRSLVYSSDLEPEVNDSEVLDNSEVIEHFKVVNKKWKKSYNKRLYTYGQTGSLDEVFSITKEALAHIDAMDKALIDRANKSKLSEFHQVDVGSLDVIVNCAYIKAFIEGKESVDIEDIKYGWNIFIKTRETSLEVFNEKQAHNEVYKYLILKPNQTHSELLALSDVVPKPKNQWQDTLALVQELAYVNSKRLKVSSGAVQRYSIEDLPRTNLDKLIISLSKDDKMEKSISYQPVELSFKDLSKLVTSKRRVEVDDNGEKYTTGTDSYCLAHFEPSTKTEPWGHRRANSYIQEANIIGFDFDATENVDDIKYLLEPYKYILYTTKSHRKAKRDFKDSFRVLLPTLNNFELTPEQYKEMMNNIFEYLEVSADIATRNVSRLWFTNPHEECEVYINDVNDLFDIEPFKPDTNSRKEMLTLLDQIRIAASNSNQEPFDKQTEQEKRITGFIKKMAITIAKGNLNDSLFKTWKFVKDLTGDELRANEALAQLRQLRGFPQRFVDEVIQQHGGKR
jgi:hypothetical protein